MLQSDELHNEEHRRWNRDHVEWLRDIEVWTAENRVLRERLRKIECVLLDIEESYEQQRDAMLAIEQEIHQHERGHQTRRSHTETRAEQQKQAQWHQRMAIRHLALAEAIQRFEELLDLNGGR